MQSRLHFEEELQLIHKDILEMSVRIEEDILKAVCALQTQDEALAREVKANDAIINAMQVKIEDQAAILIATQQPVASDLRELVTIIKTVNELERIDDYAVHLAKAVIKFSKLDNLPNLDTLCTMAKIGSSMVRDAVNALLDRNEKLAMETASHDAGINSLHKELVHNTLEFMQKNPDYITHATRIIKTAGFLERLGDHATNICEYVVYLVSGSHVELND